MTDVSLAERMAQLSLVQGQVAKEITGQIIFPSLAVTGQLDQMIDQRLPKRLHGEPAEVAEVVGAFLGEALRKELSASWQAGPKGPLLVLADGRTLDPMARALRRVTEGKIWSLEAYSRMAQAYSQDPDRTRSPEDVPARGLWRRTKRGA
ncbi:MAG: hypothetical protein ACYCO4_06955 [Sulfobacillus sp.]